ncbi:MAG: AAA family ATPase [Planctomycetota bacterium]
MDEPTRKRIVDLHVHTNRSDGDYPPAEVIRKSKHRGLTAVGITDHDSLEGIPEALEAGDREGIEVVPGVELSVKYKDLTQVHLLGYYMNWEDETFNEMLTESRDARVGRGRRLVERINRVLASEGKAPLKFAEVEKFSFGLIGRPHVAKALLEKGYCKDMVSSFKRYLIPHNIPKYKIPFDEAVTAIKNAGGIPVLAHPNLITPGRRLRSSLIDALVELGLEGMEVYYHSLTATDTHYYRTLAEERNLIITGGSDFHGEGSYGNLGYTGNHKEVPYDFLRTMKRHFLIQRAFLVVMCGLPGSGKSSLAERIAALLDADVLSTDAIRMSHFPPQSTMRSFRYSTEVSSAVYRILRLEAEVRLLQGRSVVLDATCLLREGRPEMLEMAREAKSPILFLSCTAEEEAIEARTRNRKPGEDHFSEADLEVYRQMKKDLEIRSEQYAMPEDDAQLDAYPILRWDSTPGKEKLAILQCPENLAFLLRFTLG